MSGFALCALVVGPAAVAAWSISRFPGIVPTSIRGVSTCLGVAMTVAVATPEAFAVVNASEGAVAAAAAVVVPAGIFVMFAVLSGLLATVRAVGSSAR